MLIPRTLRSVSKADEVSVWDGYVQASRPEDSSNGRLLGKAHAQRLQQPERQKQEHEVGGDIQRDQRPIPGVDIDASPWRRRNPCFNHGLAAVQERRGSHERVDDDNRENRVGDKVEALADGETEVKDQDRGLGEEDGEVVGYGDREEANLKANGMLAVCACSEGRGAY